MLWAASLQATTGPKRRCSSSHLTEGKHAWKKNRIQPSPIQPLIFSRLHFFTANACLAMVGLIGACQVSLTFLTLFPSTASDGCCVDQRGRVSQYANPLPCSWFDTILTIVSIFVFTPTAFFIISDYLLRFWNEVYWVRRCEYFYVKLLSKSVAHMYPTFSKVRVYKSSVYPCQPYFIFREASQPPGSVAENWPVIELFFPPHTSVDHLDLSR